MRQARFRLVIIFGLCVFLLLSAAATAQPPEPRTKPLQLGVHAFTPSADRGDPFIRTHFNSSIGIGQALDLCVPVIEIDTLTIVGLHGNLLFAVLDFEYQYAMKDWLAVWVQPQLLARLGTDVQTLLSQGISAAMGFELGTMFKLYHSDRWALSGTLNLRNSDATVINLLEFVDGIVDSGYVVVPLVRAEPLLTGGAGVRVAWAANDLLGFLGNLSFGVGENADVQKTTQVFYDFGVTVDCNVNARTAVPMGVSLAYDQNTRPGVTSDVANISRAVRLTLGYTGKYDYFIGLDLSYQWLPSLFEDQTINSGTILITTRYFF